MKPFVQQRTDRSEPGRGNGSNYGWCDAASLAVALLALCAALAGLFTPVYQDNAWAVAGYRGSDLITAFLAVPLMCVALLRARSGSLRWRLVWLGLLAYFAYTYAYAFAIAWNQLFGLYVVLFAGSIWTLVAALIRTDANAVKASVQPDAPVRAVSRYLLIFGSLLGALWVLQIAMSLLTGTIPQSVIDSGHPTAPVFLLDLGFVVPLFLVGGIWLRNGHPWGYVLAAVLLVKGIAEGLALLAMAALSFFAGVRVDAYLIPLWVAVTVVSAALSVLFLRRVGDS